MVILKVCTNLYAVESTDTEIADINAPKPNLNASPDTQLAEASNVETGPFIFPTLDFNSAVGSGTSIEISSTSGTTSKKPGPSKGSGKMRPGTSNTAR